MTRTAILVLGMHRSGTSALTRIIGHLGAALPRDPMPPTADNPRGYWESRGIARLNNRLLESAGTRWNDDAPVPDGWFLEPARSADVDAARRLLAAEYGDEPLFVLKDPRICRLLPFWRNVLAAEGIEPRVVLALRDPAEVAGSLRARLDDEAFRPAAIAAPERSLLLWLRHVLEAEARSRDLPRVAIDYRALVADWRKAVRDLVALVPLPTITFEGATAIDAFLSSDLRRQRDPGPAADAAAEALRRIAADVAGACAARDPGSAVAASHRRLDALRATLDRLVTALAVPRIALPVTAPSDPWAGAILAEISRVPAVVAPPTSGARALFLSAAPLSAGHAYRVVHACEALAARGWRTEWLPLDDDAAVAAVDGADVVTVFRGRWGDRLAAIRERCTARGIPLVHDIDDLVFDPAVMAAGAIDFIARLPEESRRRWLADAALHRRALAEGDACVVTTGSLARAAAEVVADVHVLPNGPGAAMVAAAAAARSASKPSAVDGRPRIGFASGTPTHQRDFATVAGAVASLLDRRPDLGLVVVGHLDLAAVPELARHAPRIEVRPAVTLVELHADVARFDVNLAPLETGNPFCEAKSPIRCVTAALVGVPSVVAATAALAGAVIDGETGWIAPDAAAWVVLVGRLLDDPARRLALGEAARVDALARLGPEARAEQAGRIYDSILAAAEARRGDSR